MFDKAKFKIWIDTGSTFFKIQLKIVFTIKIESLTLKIMIYIICFRIYSKKL